MKTTTKKNNKQTTTTTTSFKGSISKGSVRDDDDIPTTTFGRGGTPRTSLSLSAATSSSSFVGNNASSGLMMMSGGSGLSLGGSSSVGIGMGAAGDSSTARISLGELDERYIAPASGGSNSNERTSKATQHMTINKLRFTFLVGRSDEIQKLHECAIRAQKLKTKELIWISGNSGTGKTALAKTIMEEDNNKMNNKRPSDGSSNEILFLSSKFDQNLRDNKEPYAGIAGICRDLVRHLLPQRETNPNKLMDISNGFTNALGSGLLGLLLELIPEFEELFSHQQDRQQQLDDSRSQSTYNAQAAGTSLKERMNRIVYAFRLFFRQLSVLYPTMLVLIFDDVQWADFASLHLLEMILTDDEIRGRGLVVVACYRSDEVYDAHIVSQMIRNLEYHKRTTTMQQQQQQQLYSNKEEENDDEGSGGGFYITDIHVGNLSVDQVQELLLELFNLSKDNGRDVVSVQQLAEICHRKTLGNAFFLKHFLTHLHEELGLLSYNFGVMAWMWDDHEVSTKTVATDNVLDLLKQKMHCLPTNVDTLLAMLACVGAEFPQPVMHILWSEYCIASIQQQQQGGGGIASSTSATTTKTTTEFETLVAAAVQEGFLEHDGTGDSYRFVHDKLQEVALLYADPVQLPRMKQIVGQIIIKELRKGTMAGHLLFVAVNLLNEGVIPETEEDRASLADLNLQAAQKGVESSDFTSASKYIEYGIQLLPHQTKWSDDQCYNKTLELHTLGAEVELFLGNLEKMQGYCDRVLEQTHRPLPDHFRVYNVLQFSLLNRNLLLESAQLGFDVSKKLGYKFPKRGMAVQVAVVSRIVKAQMGLKKRTIEEINNLPFMDDPSLLQVMQVLDRAGTSCYMGKDPRLPLTILTIFELTLKHGLSQFSAPAYASFALILAGALEDFDGARKIADCANVIMEKYPSRDSVARTMFLLGSFVLPWIQPYQNMQKPLLNGYYEGLSVGDNESSGWCIYCYVGIGFQLGKNLALLEADARIYEKQLNGLQILAIATYFNLLLHTIMELSGKADTNLALDINEFEGKMNDLERQTMLVHQSRLCTFFGHHAEAAALSLQRGDKFRKDALGHFWNMSDAFYRGISLYAHAQETKQRKYKRLAKKQRSIIKGWAKNRNPNVSHCECLLDAENEAAAGRMKKAEDLFQKGIVMAARTGFLQDAALGSERCAAVLLPVDREAAKYRLEEAIRYYREWGSPKKVELLQKEYADLLPRPPSIIIAEIKEH